MTLLVGLDLSLTGTGVCVAGACDTIRTRETGMDRLHRILMDVLQAVEGADLVLIEGYSFGSKGAAVYQIGELGGIVRYQLWDRSIPYVDVPPASLKLFATGKANANKDAMVATAARAGCLADDNNAVDAWWLYQMGLASTSAGRAWLDDGDSDGDCLEGHVPLTAYRKQAIAKVAWPRQVFA